MKNFQVRAPFLTITDHTTAVCLALLSMAGALKVVFGLGGYGIYYVAVGALTVVGLLRCAFALRSLQWHVTPFSRLLAALGLEKRVALYLLLYSGLFAWLFISTLWTSVPAPIWKEDFFYICVLLCVIILTALCIRRETAEKVLIYWVAGALAISIYVLSGTIAASNSAEYMKVFKGVQLTLATPQGVALVISLFYLQTAKGKGRKVFWFLLTALFVAGVGRSVARGTLVFSLFAIAVSSCFYLWHCSANFLDRLKRIGLYALAGMLLISGLLCTVLLVKDRSPRIVRLNTLSGRAKIWGTVWTSIQEAPIFGHGLGTNGVNTAKSGYPHNLFLQVWLDGGIVAALMLGVLVLWPLILFVKRFPFIHRDPVFLSLFALLMLLVLEFSKSYDFYAGISLVVVSVLSMKYVEMLES